MTPNATRAFWQHVVTEAEMDAMTALSGDHNAVHLSDEVARVNGYPSRLVYGLLVASFLPRVYAMVAPGRSFICLSQSLRFSHPVFIGDEISIAVEVKHSAEELGLMQLETTVTNQAGQCVLAAEAKIKLLRSA